LLKFIENAKPGTRMGLLQLGSHLKILQGVTDDKQLLFTAMRDLNTGVLDPIAERRTCPDRLSLSQTTVNTMNFLSLYLGNLPGRKNLLWFAGGFAFNLFQDEPCLVTMNDFREATLKLGSMQVSIYPMVERSDYRNLGPPSDDLKEWARLTGGHAYSNANDIAGESGAAVDDGSSYYTLAYVPQNQKWDGSFRNIKITLTNGTHAELSYRQGYFADDPNGPPRKTAIFGKAKAAANQEPRPGAMQMALMLGTPSATQVTFLTHILPAGAKEEPAPAANNDVAPGVKGPYQRYTVRLAANISTLHPTEDADGTRHFSLEFVTMVYDLKGAAVNSVGSTGQIAMPPAAYERALKDGLSLQSEVSVPSNGDYTLRVGIHDLNNDHVGSVEAPISAVKNLPPAATQR
jgi:hypothetical protein